MYIKNICLLYISGNTFDIGLQPLSAVFAQIVSV